MEGTTADPRHAKVRSPAGEAARTTVGLRPPSPNVRSMLRRFRTAHDRGFVVRLRDVEFDVPPAKEIHEGLAHYLTDSIVLGGEPMLWRCMRDSVDRYHEACSLPSGAFDAFVAALLDPTRALAAVEIVDGGGGTASWHAEEGTSLLVWLGKAKGPFSGVPREPADADAVVGAVRAHVLPSFLREE